MPNALCIEDDSVFQALEAMRQGKALDVANPLSQFVSIQQPYAPSVTLQGPAVSDLKVFRTLIHVIRSRLNHHRQLLGLSPVSPRNQALTAAADFQFENTELQAWSVLYYRYVRVDLDLSPKQLAKLVGQAERTIHRRQRMGIRRLTHRLTQRELRVRARLRQALLRIQLPRTPQLLGRDTLLQLARQHLDNPNQRIILYGAPGIGKTALAAALARALIDDNVVQNAAWIDHPTADLDALCEQIALQLHIPLTLDARPTLPGYLSIVPSIIILDNAHEIDLAALNQLLAILGETRIILCARIAPQLRDVAYIQVPELDKTAAFDLMERQAELLGSIETAGITTLFERMYSDLGGNPEALYLALSANQYHSSTIDSTNLYTTTWEAALPTARLLWLTLTLYPITNAMGLAHLLPDTADADLQDSIAALYRMSVLDLSSRLDKRLSLLPSARTFAEQIMLSAAERPLLTQAMRSVADALAERPDPTLCLQLLTFAQRVDLPLVFVIDLAYAFAPIIERAGAWLAWQNILNLMYQSALPVDRPWLRLHQAIALRWSGQSTEAIYVLGEAITLAGQHGLFELQADAMFELAILYRYRQDYAAAESLLARVQPVYQRYELAVKLQRVTAESIALALAVDNQPFLQDALKRLLTKETSESPRLLSLAAQVALHLGDLNAALSFAQRAQAALGDDYQRGRIWALLGQIYQQRGEWRTAIAHILCGLPLMQQTQDVVGQARARLNIALIHLGRGALTAALPYLHGLPAELAALGDVEGLQAAVRCLEVLNSRTGRA